jgi:ABC-type Fe3+-siderophore transport system permease subunit
LVSPDILGASSGAAFGAVLGIYWSLGVVAHPDRRDGPWHRAGGAVQGSSATTHPVSEAS